MFVDYFHQAPVCTFLTLVKDLHKAESLSFAQQFGEYMSGLTIFGELAVK